MLSRDIRPAHRLGFAVMWTKMPVSTDELAPVQNWREIIRMTLTLAEKLDIQMCPEIHTPTNLKGFMVSDFVEFIKETGTKNFGLNVDFSVYHTEYAPGEYKDTYFTPNVPADLIPLIPHIYCCHAKFIHMNDEFEETTILYKEIIRVLKDNQWDGYLLSEYEGADKYDDGYEVGQTLRKHHIMMENYIGD